MSDTSPTIQEIIASRGVNGALEHLAEEIEKLKSATAKPSSSSQKPSKSEEAKGADRG